MEGLKVGGNKRWGEEKEKKLPNILREMEEGFNL